MVKTNQSELRVTGFQARSLAVVLAGLFSSGTLLAAASEPVTTVAPLALADQEALLVGYLHLGEARKVGSIFDAAKFTDEHTIKERLILEHAIRLDPTETAESVQLLLRKGVKPRDLAFLSAPRPPYEHYPYLPIILAIELGKTAAARVLIALGGEQQLSYNSPRYGTPLMRAAASGNIDIVKDLLACPTVDSFLNERQCGSHRTALHLAVRSKVAALDKYDDYNEIAAALITAGINLRATNYADQTARDLAIKRNNPVVLGLIDERLASLDQARKAAEKAAFVEQKAREQAAKAALAAQKAQAKAAAKTSARFASSTVASSFTDIAVSGGAGDGIPLLDARGAGRHRWFGSSKGAKES